MRLRSAGVGLNGSAAGVAFSRLLLSVLAFLSILTGGCTPALPTETVPTGFVPVSAPLTTDSAGQGRVQAELAVFRVQCVSSLKGGSGFLHASRQIITAAHVVAGCKASELQLVSSAGIQYGATAVREDPFVDLAVIKPSEDVLGVPLRLAPPGTSIRVGTQVVTWGFPSGYLGSSALLSVGYVAGFESVKVKPPVATRQIVVNASFNLGNSGGPLIDVESGSVVGVVSNKLDSMPEQIQKAVGALKAGNAGVVYTRRFPDGREEQLLESQVVAEILDWFRAQAQLVVGRAVTVDEVRRFLLAEGIVP